MKKDKYSSPVYSRVLKYLQESKTSTYVFAALIGALLTIVPIALSQMPDPNFKYVESGWGKSVQAVNTANFTNFVGDASGVTNGTALFNFLGGGANDTFTLLGGNSTTVFVATGGPGSKFNVTTGNPVSNTNSSTFSLMGGANSTFFIVQNNVNGSVLFAITGGPGGSVNETSPFTNLNSTTTWSINMGYNSTVTFNTEYEGNWTNVNVVF